MFKTIEAIAGKNYPVQTAFLCDGRLNGDWANVRQHCLIQFMASEVLADYLGLDAESKRRLASVAIAHDWRKRLDRCPADFNDLDGLWIKTVDETASRVLDQELMGALTPWFLVRVLEGKATFLQLIQFYIDDIAKGGEVVRFDERIDEVSARNPDPEPAVREALGRPYWDVEREVGHRVEAMLFRILDARNILVEHQEQIPKLILQEIHRRLEDGETTAKAE